MTKHKKFRSLRGKGKYANAYAARHRQNPYASALHPSQLKKKTAPSAANTESGKKTQQDK